MLGLARLVWLPLPIGKQDRFISNLHGAFWLSCEAGRAPLPPSLGLAICIVLVCIPLGTAGAKRTSQGQYWIWQLVLFRIKGQSKSRRGSGFLVSGYGIGAGGKCWHRRREQCLYGRYRDCDWGRIF